ncbi:MAG TPA: glycosyltransferase family 4 protein [Candidatus Saccharimonadales bacterium]|nr:glycosyltransferase family 4 protein [Candidatus Saccharimonadales bacterium]
MLGWELPPHNSGGLGVACYQLCKALSKQNVDIEFVLPYQAEHDIDFMEVTAAHPQGVLTVLEAGGIYDSNKYIYEDGREEWLDIVGQQALYEKSVAKLVAGKTFDVIHAHDWLTFRAGLHARQLSNCPLILHVHSIERDRAGGNFGNPVVREIESLAFQLADHIIAVSQITKDAIVADYGIPADKVEVVHNSIDRELMIPLDDDNAYAYLSRLKDDGWRIITNVGRLTIQKGLFNLLYAAQAVVAREPKTMFLIVGNGEQYHELISLAAELGISRNVIFTGFQRGKNWRDSFGIADLFVMPSISEPYGLTALEAIEYGAPVLVSKQSGVGETIQNCLRVDSWDVGELSNQMTNVVRSDSLRDELHYNAYRELEKLSWNDAAGKLHNAYRRHVPHSPRPIPSKDLVAA